MIKKILIIALALVLCTAALAGCDVKPAEDDGKISVVATIFPEYDFVRAIAGDKVNTTMLLSPGAEAHSYEPMPEDIQKIQSCDLFIYVGGESDSWVGTILDSMDTSGMKIITLMDCVEVVEEEIVEGMQEETEEAPGEGSEEPEYDEHVWTSPRNAKMIVQKISDALCELDVENAEEYKANTSEYLGKLDELDALFKQTVDGGVRKTIIFGDRFPFRYLADAYGLKYFAAFPGCSTETEPSAKTVAFLIDKVKAENIPVVFHIQLSNERMANAIAEQTGASVLLLHSCEGITKADFDAGKSYIDIMSANVDALREALS
ncbi:MAG: metal ABC transporter substrate-binding protein [Clostridium sp.]|jgi:zinc transport system substrate-binding protein|nr:metal ABC transporter substrate-binding protein [Clostridium sp.]